MTAIRFTSGTATAFKTENAVKVENLGTINDKMGRISGGMSLIVP